MKCSEFIEKCTIEPGCQETEFVAHRDECADCAREAEGLTAFEGTLAQAAAVEVPAGLADRILARHAIALGAEEEEAKVVSLDRARARRSGPARPIWQQWYALAASLLLVVGLVGGGFYLRDTGMPLEQQVVVALKDSMPMYDKMVVAHEIDPNIENNLGVMLRNVGARQVAELGQVNYCITTKVGEKMGGVMVFPGKMGAVTVVYIVDAKVSGRKGIAEGGMEGVMWPERKGSIAVIGHPGEPMIGDVEQRVRRAVEWL